MMDSAPLIHVSLYPALEFVEIADHLVGEALNLGQVLIHLSRLVIEYAVIVAAQSLWNFSCATPSFSNSGM